jgi:hypothetical protein
MKIENSHASATKAASPSRALLAQGSKSDRVRALLSAHKAKAIADSVAASKPQNKKGNGKSKLVTRFACFYQGGGPPRGFWFRYAFA